MDWTELFPERDYELALRLRRGDPAAFFKSHDPEGRVLAERGRWLDEAPGHHLVMVPGAEGLVDEFARMLPGWAGEGQAGCPPHGAGLMEALGRRLEADFVLLGRVDGVLRLLGGCVCFPSSWSLREKANLSVEQIHSVVPGLNTTIGRSIDLFLARLAPGIAWLRENWGLSATGELNQDPWRRLPRLDHGFDPAGVFVRVEHQALVRLPETDGVLFGIRVEVRPLVEVVRETGTRTRLLRALSSMPEAMAVYKGLQPVREALCDWLRQRG